MSDNKVRKVLVKYKNQGEGGFRFSERPSNKIVLVVPYEDQQYGSEQFKGVQSGQETELEAAEAGSQPMQEAAENAGEPLIEAAESAGEHLREATEVMTRSQGEAREVPRDLSCSSKEAAKDEEDESATGAEAGPDAAPAEAVHIHNTPSRAGSRQPCSRGQSI